MQTLPKGSLLEYKGSERLKKLADECVNLTCQRAKPLQARYGSFDCKSKKQIRNSKIIDNCIAN